MWTYSISQGKLSDGTRTIDAYSGREGEWKNNPDSISVVDYGPIPIGRYTIGTAFADATHGNCVMRLSPLPETETYGRSGFLIHGDSRTHPGNASHGCIVTCGQTPLADREYINSSLDKELEVTG